MKDLWKWSTPLIKKYERRDAKYDVRSTKCKSKGNELAGLLDQTNGLICLKGGDLAQEIFESGLRPDVIAIDEVFKEEEFENKYLLYVKR